MADQPTAHRPDFLVKWERHHFGHSMYTVTLAFDQLVFVPHSRSLLNSKFEIPHGLIHEVVSSDNFLYRGAVNIALKTELELDLDFNIPKGFNWSFRIFEPESVFRSKRIRLFLGSNRTRFLEAVKTNSMQTQQ